MQLPTAHALLAKAAALPLYGGGFWVAFLQLCAFYYPVGFALHYVVPRLVSVKAIQRQQRKDGDVLRDACYSIGEGHAV